MIDVSTAPTLNSPSATDAPPAMGRRVPHNKGARKARTQDYFLFSPFAGDKREFVEIVARRVGCPVIHAGNVIRWTRHRRYFDWKVCREACLLAEEWDARERKLRERKRIYGLLTAWLSVDEVIDRSGVSRSGLAYGISAGSFITRPVFGSLDPLREVELLACSVLPLPTSTLIPPASIEGLRAAVIAEVRARLSTLALLEGVQLG